MLTVVTTQSFSSIVRSVEFAYTMRKIASNKAKLAKLKATNDINFLCPKFSKEGV